MQADQKQTRRARLKQWRQAAPNALSAHLFFGAMLMGLWRWCCSGALFLLANFWSHKHMQNRYGG